jgi:hypothetical protein
MDLKTSFVTDDDGHIAIEEPFDDDIDDDARFFYFQTRTEMTFGEGDTAKTIAVRTSRKMAFGLLTYFLGNKTFQDLILRQNQAHATQFFNQR